MLSRQLIRCLRPRLSVQSLRTASRFDQPRPHPLPPQQQKEFEELVRKAQAPMSSAGRAAIEELHPDVRQKPAPAFEGDRNPSTGEVGGPKRDPLLYNKEWTYGGRATDF